MVDVMAWAVETRGVYPSYRVAKNTSVDIYIT